MLEGTSEQTYEFWSTSYDYSAYVGFHALGDVNRFCAQKKLPVADNLLCGLPDSSETVGSFRMHAMQQRRLDRAGVREFASLDAAVARKAPVPR
jgi:hypothetical protein